MKTAIRVGLGIALLATSVAGAAESPAGNSDTNAAAITVPQPASSASKPQPAPGVEAAKTISTITGVAISPLLGVGAVGAYQYWRAPQAQRPGLPWFAQPWFWVPALLLVTLVAAKDILGTTAPTSLKKPFDVAEAIENKISALIAAGAFVPLMIAIFPESSSGQPSSMLTPGFAAVDAGAIANIILVPFAVVIFAMVWLSSHAINMLILLSPFAIVDAGLKAVRLLILGLVMLTSFINPYVGAAFCAVVIVAAYFLAGWSFRLTMLGTIFAWDFATLRRKRFQPGTEANRMFTARKIEDAPIRTLGRLIRPEKGDPVFEYRPWLILRKKSFPLPPGKYVVGRGFFYAEISHIPVEGAEGTLFLLPPRYQGHEEALRRAYGFDEVRDAGLLKGFKSVWSWIKSLFGVSKPGEEPRPAPAT